MYSGVLNRRTFPIYPKRHARGDLVAKCGRDGVKLVPRVAPLSSFGRSSLHGLWVASSLEGSTGTLRGRPGQVVPDGRGLLVAETVRYLVPVEALHVGAGFQAPGARVFDGPPPRLEVVYDLQGLEHQGISERQVAGALLECDAELGAAGRGPRCVEVPRLEGFVVPLQDVGADGWAGFGLLSRLVTSQPWASKARPTDPVPLNSSRSLIC